MLVLRDGRVDENYNIGGEEERTTRGIVDGICSILEELMPASKNAFCMEENLGLYTDRKQFVENRPGHDRRYTINSGKIRSELKWSPQHTFKIGLQKIVEWYFPNREWCQQVLGDRYERQRLGILAND